MKRGTYLTSQPKNDSGTMNEQIDSASNRVLLNDELDTVISYQADRVNSINERTSWLLVFAALNVSTLMVSSFAAFRSQLVGQSDAYAWWQDLFVLDILLYLLTIIFGYMGQRIRVQFAHVDTGERSLAELMADNPSDLKERLLETKFSLFQENERLVEHKTSHLNTAYGFLLAAVALLFIVVLAATVL